MSTNNGQKGYLNESPEYLNEGNTISFGQDTATMFYQEKPYFTGDKIKILKPKFGSFSKRNAQFFLTTMNKAFHSFSWGTCSFSVDAIKKQRISLPVNNGEIDIEFINDFVAELEAERVAELEAERVAELEAYLTVTGLKDYKLTEKERLAIENLNTTTFKEFNALAIFNIKNTSNLLSRDITENSGITPYLCASAENNAVSSYISYNETFLNEGNCVFIGGKTFVVTYQKQDFFSNDSHNLALYLKKQQPTNESIFLGLVTCVNRSLKHKYSWGNSISSRKIKSDAIMLPVKNDKPDFDTLETLISAVKKLVIKDVVEYANHKIRATKQVIAQ